MFDQSVFDPALWPDQVKRLTAGERVGVKVGFDEKGAYNPEVICSTEDELADQVYEAFRYTFDKNLHHLIWGLNGRVNPIREPAHCYYDGLVYWVTRREFLDCLGEYTIDRVFSFLSHYRYGWEIRVIEPTTT